MSDDYRLSRDPLVKLLSKRLQGALEVNEDIRGQLRRCQEHNSHLLDALQQHGVIRTTATALDEVCPPRRRWWVRALDFLRNRYNTAL